MIKRCAWVNEASHQYIQYHDQEWGVPVHDDKIHFEFLILEGAQAGLSWNTILNKRKGYQLAFAHWDVKKVAAFSENRIQKLMVNPDIVRNQLKIRSAVVNAQNFIKIQQSEGSFDNYVWSFVGGQPKVNQYKTLNDVPASTPESDALSKDLKKRGFKFVGTTIMYAYMQAVGLVNDHTTDCFRYTQV